MDARFERYVENLRTVRTLSQPKFSPDMKAKELLETIQSNAIKCFDYMKENNAILNELVFQRAPAELTSAEIASLQEFADKMFNYASSEDCGIAYKVYSLLLENARIRGRQACHRPLSVWKSGFSPLPQCPGPRLCHQPLRDAGARPFSGGCRLYCGV